MAKNTCVVDGVKFEAKRADAKFCSDKCRKKYARDNNINPKTGEIIVETKGVTAKISPNLLVEDPRGRTKELVDWREFGNPQSPYYIENPFERPKDPEYDYEKALAGFQKIGLARTEWITTGIKALDEFQRIPRGRVTQIQGPYAVGKTTLALNMVAGLSGHKVFYVDSEASLNPVLLAQLGVDTKNFDLYNESAFIEDVYEVVLEAAKAGKYDMIVIDSLASMTFRTEEEGKATDSNIGQKAKVVNKLMRIIPMYLKNSDTALVIINQEREMIGTYVPTKYTPGGMGVPYAASLILALKTIPSWRFPKDAKNGAYKGHEIEVTIIKSKVSQPHRKQKIKLYYPQPVEVEDDGEETPF